MMHAIKIGAVWRKACSSRKPYQGNSYFVPLYCESERSVAIVVLIRRATDLEDYGTRLAQVALRQRAAFLHHQPMIWSMQPKGYFWMGSCFVCLLPPRTYSTLTRSPALW